MITLLVIISVTTLASLGITQLLKYLSYSEKEEDRVPVENYDLIKSKPKKVTKSKTKK